MPSFADLDGQIVHYHHRPGAAGRRPVVFANSLGTDFRLWDDVVARLPAETPLLRLDKRGHGLSALGPVTIETLAADMAALMDMVGMRGAVICGVSVGGLIAQALAAARPDLVSGSVLSNTGLKIGDAAMWTPRIEAVRAGGVEAVADAVLERWFPPAYRAEQAVSVAGWRAMLTRTPAEGYARVGEAIRDWDFTAKAASHPPGAICLAGSEDGSTPPALVRAMAEALPGAEYRELPGVGHLPCVQTPEAVVEAIRALAD
jgi:3-oxoadipate enol-lactonase